MFSYSSCIRTSSN